MESKQLQHFGVPGMRWGQRKNKYTTLNKTLSRSRKTGQRFLNTRKHGVVVSKKAVTAKEAKAFVAKRKKEMALAHIERAEKHRRFVKAVRVVTAVYSVVSIARMFSVASNSSPRPSFASTSAYQEWLKNG